MILVNEVESSSIISPTTTPRADFVINPYIGCSHGCIYCYARFMKRFTGHQEKWGKFVDVKVNGAQLVPHPRPKFKGSSILLSSVTDPYLQLEKKYELTRRIIQELLPLEGCLMILTKSDLVLRDLDILEKMKKVEIGFSFSTLNENLRKETEPHAKTIEERLNALIQVKESGFKNFLFISPILPYLTPWKDIIDTTRDYVDYYMFENLNVNGSVWPSVLKWLKKFHPHLVEEYRSIYYGESSYWIEEKQAIKDYCKKEKLVSEFYFHHKKTK